MAEERPEEKTAEKTVEEEKTSKPQQTRQVDENMVFIGRKPVMNYVVACLTCFNSGCKEVVVKARGRSIILAVDTVELLRRSFIGDLQLLGISIDTEQVTGIEGQTRSVSTIEITLAKP